jgi:hypothetical protein
LQCSQNFLDTEGFDWQPDLSAVPAVPIANEVSGSIPIGERLYDLLWGPITGRMLGHIEVQQLATIVFEDDEYEEHLYRDGRYRKKIV